MLPDDLFSCWCWHPLAQSRHANHISVWPLVQAPAYGIAGERALERAGERALERAGERAMERAGNTI